MQLKSPALLGWFISNPIAANLFMVVLVVGGLYSIPGLDKQFFPTPVDRPRQHFAMPFPGASPSEVEEQICVRIEEAIHDLDGIKEVRSTASEGMGQVIVEALDRLPHSATHQPRSRHGSMPLRLSPPMPSGRSSQNYLSPFARYCCNWRAISMSGSSRKLGKPCAMTLARQPWISVVDLVSPRRYEVSVNVSELDLRRHKPFV